MTRQRQVFVCQVCGNVVEVLRAGGGTLVCCKQPMTPAEENTTDASREKHVPVIARAEGKLGVTVGSIAHPMATDHYIEWIEVVHGDGAAREYLKPGETPRAEFACPGGPVAARAYCNLHGLWRAEG
ncbi:MAG: desulfoferrodoxin [Dehalococcoidia bacterium]|nr:desulfoferrodoxin [Dehalococcoidia bacterium]